MDSPDEGSGERLIGKAVEAAMLAKKTKKEAEKNAKEALVAARREKKMKSVMVESSRRKAAQKATLQSYFTSTRGAGSGQPLLDVPKLDGLGNFPSCDSTPNERSAVSGKTVSIDTTMTPGSPNESGDTRVLSSKSPLIALSNSHEDVDNSCLLEVPDASEGEDDEVESPPRKKGATMRNKAETTKSKDQKRYDRHRN